jgi:hypothetical protein
VKKYIIVIMLAAIAGFAPAASASDRGSYVPAVYTGSGENQFELVGKRHKNHRHHNHRGHARHRSHRSGHRHHQHYQHRYHHHSHYRPYYYGYPGYGSPYYSPYRNRYISPGFGGFYRF